MPPARWGPGVRQSAAAAAAAKYAIAWPMAADDREKDSTVILKWFTVILNFVHAYRWWVCSIPTSL